MSNKSIFIGSAGEIPKIEVFFGQANWGAYEIWLYESNGKDPKIISKGINTDHIADISEIGSPQSLNGRILYWYLRTARFDGSSTGQFFMKVVVSQNGQELYAHDYQGSFDGLAQDAIGFLKIIAS